MFDNEQVDFNEELSRAYLVKDGKVPGFDVLDWWWDKFRIYELKSFIKSLNRALMEQQGRLTPDKVYYYLPDPLGHPLPEEAWNGCPKGEGDSGYVTDQMIQAHASCSNCIERGDMIGARMAFIESYKRHVSEAKIKGVRAKFWFSGGKGLLELEREHLKESKLLEASAKGWINEDVKNKRLKMLAEGEELHLPILKELDDQTYLQQQQQPKQKLLESDSEKREETQEEVERRKFAKAYLAKLRKGLAGG